MKLKTLKEIDEEAGILTDIGGIISVSNLREEVIKNLKEMEKLPCTSCECCGIACQKIWIRHFFNITNKEVEELH